MKSIVKLIVLVSLPIFTFGQANDSSLIRKNQVLEIKKNLYVHAFIENNDTCLFNHQKFNEEGMMVYEKSNMICMGWPSTEEVFIEYGERGISQLEVKRDGKPFSRATYKYDTIGKAPIWVKTFFYQTNDSTVLTNVYSYGDDDLVDSTHSTLIQQDGTTKITKSIAVYNERNEPVQLYTIAEDRTPIEMASYEMADNGLILSTAYTTYGDKPRFTQIFYAYNQNERVAHSYNTTNQKQEYFYLDNGLLNNEMHYNPKGELEAEYIFEYIYAE